jgi:hypothetical protein
MFSSTPEYIHAVTIERERETRLVLMAREAEHVTRESHPARAGRSWPQVFAVRMPRSLHAPSVAKA